MRRVLGVDTSNYTTSCALWEDGRVVQKKRLLPVREGQLGLRQSDAVFHHTQQLPPLLEGLFAESPGPVEAVGVSARPRSQEGSYMPCFTVGLGTARSIAAALGVPCRTFSHQDGHVAAALYSAGQLPLFGRRFLAFHVSGGTTEALLSEPDGAGGFSLTLAASSLDLKAGQAVDRVGLMLGLTFPCGPGLSALAQTCTDKIKVRPTMKGADCCLSGIENRCRKLKEEGKPDAYIARYCLLSVGAALEGMTEALLEKYGPLPLLYAGGVMASSVLRPYFARKYGGFFADPAFSSDNAAGVALLAAVSAGERVRASVTE